MPFHFHLSWSAPPPVKQAARAWIIQDAHLALYSAAIILLLVQLRDEELESPYNYSFLAGLYSVEYMALVAVHVRWRWVRNLDAMRKVVACFLVNSPAVVLIVSFTAALWGLYFNDVRLATCLSWVLVVTLVVFLWWCISIDRALSHNSPAHPQGKTDDVLDKWACDCEV
ncbi:unnamed protein product [Alopecurus aequalis]